MMSGASLAALQLMGLGGTGRAFAAGITVATTRGSLTVPATGAVDFIEVTNTGHVNGSVTNEGTVGVSEVGISVDNGGSITGSIVNAKSAVVSATRQGVFVGTTALLGGAISNAGKILVVNDRSGSESAAATGIYWANPGLHAAVTNSGAITAHAAAGFTSTASVDAFGALVGAGKHGSENMNLEFTNSGKIQVTALALATSEVRAHAVGIAIGTRSHSISGSTVDAVVHNTGSLTVHATARDTGGSADIVTAKATGVAVNVSDTAHEADAGLTNSGSISVRAQATGAYAFADAIGAGLQAVANGSNAAAATLVNSDTIHALADVKNARGSASGANAHALGIALLVQASSGAAMAKATNLAGGHITASAKATGSIRIAASASGAHLRAEGKTATVALSNSGDISVLAQVQANGHAVANALGATLIADGTNASAVMINAAGAHLDVSAKATDPVVHASATASAIGVREDETGKKTVAQVANSGTIDVKAVASAASSSGDALARAEAYGIEQSIGGKSATNENARFTNAAGAVLQVTASAQASAPGKTASAQANGRVAVAQDGFGGGAGSSVDLSLSNSGSIIVDAHAVATGAAAHALAVLDSHAEGVISQNVLFASTANLSIKNAGTIDAVGDAVAHGGAAHAAAELDYGVYQFVESAQAASMQITNAAPGKITEHLAASAFATGTGKAVASAQLMRGIGQQGDIFSTASKAGVATAGISNSGSIDISAFARAQGSHVATATARAHSSHSSGIRAMGISQALRGAHSSSRSLPADEFTESFTNTNSGTISIGAKAVASNLAETGTGNVHAFAGMNAGIAQWATSAAKAVLSFSNAGKIAIGATATAVALVGTANADAFIDEGIAQDAEATQASENFSNSGSITIDVAAKAAGVTHASAQADVYAGVDQYEQASGASETLDNSGAIRISETAHAQADVKALADVSGEDPYVVYQDIRAERGASPATIALINEAGGILSASGLAVAIGKTATAYARYTGVGQEVYGTNSAALSLENAGTIGIKMADSAVGSAAAVANAYALGIEQRIYAYYATGTPITGEISATNSGTLSVAANAVAKGAAATARATAIGAVQDGEYLAFTADFANTGKISVAAAATAAGGKATANATGLFVNGFGRVTRTSRLQPVSAEIEATNSGTINVTANAAGATAQAVAKGIVADLTSEILHKNTSASGINTYSSEEISAPVSGNVENDGVLTVQAAAAGGKAEADGVELFNTDQTVTVTNKGSIDVAATGATAVARGLYEHGWSQQEHQTYHWPSGHFASQRTETSVDGPAELISGTIENDGVLSVGANGTVSAAADAVALNAWDVSATIDNKGKITAAASGASAAANGIHVFAQNINHFHTTNEHYDSAAHKYVTATQKHTSQTAVHGNAFSGKIENDGTITVSAKANGGKAVADGINLEVDHYTGAIVNTGTIHVVANGTTAVADDIVITDFPVPPSGTGSIENNGGTLYAGVSDGGAVTRDNAIDLSAAPNPVTIGLNGGTIYGNVVESAGGNAITVGSGNTLFDGVINPSKAKLGTLTIAAGGTLELAANAAEGAGAAYVNNYVQNGTLMLDVTPGTNGTITANSATLGGAASVKPMLGNGVYGPKTTYKVVFSDTPITTQWSSVSIAGGSVFLSAAGQYTTNEADVVVTRIAFNAVPDLTPNEKGVGGVLEAIYDSMGTTGPMGNLVLALFHLDQKDYSAALDSLSGEQIGEIEAGNMAAVNSFFEQIQDHIGAGSAYGTQTVSLGGAAVTPAQASGLVGSVWGGAFGSWGNTSATISGPGYTTSNNGLILGYDRPVLPNLTLGVAGEYSNGSLSIDQSAGSGTFSGVQVSAYGRFTFDSGVYALGDVSVGSYTDRSRRFVSIPGFGSGNVLGKFSTRVFGIYGEAGYTYQTGSFVNLTPYVALRYQDGGSGAFDETGLPAVNLHVDAANSVTTSSFIGLSFSTMLQAGEEGTFEPHVKIAWKHDFTSNAWVVNAAFAAVPADGFAVNGSALSKESAVLGAGVTAKVGDDTNAMLDYDGRYSADHTENTIMGRLRIKF
jgi:uncharacterized protein with beta-barrel porin domain